MRGSRWELIIDNYQFPILLKTGVWIIGKTVADDLKKLKIDFQGWIYQHGASRSPKINMELGWPELLRNIG